MNQRYLRTLILAPSILLAACGNYLPATITSQVIGNQVASGVIGKVIFDPIWEFFIGKPNEKELNELKSSFATEAAKSIVEALIPSAHAGEIRFKCDSNEPQEDCRNRASSLATYQFDIYAGKFSAAFTYCRDEVVLSPATGAKDYTEQVTLITQCISEAGFSREIAAIMNHIQRRG